ncbi:MAG: SH3 domain-containing protein [Caldilineaceae bacterium]
MLVARILADRLNVRSDPTTDASVVGKLFVGNEVTVLDRADDGAWIQVQVDGVERPPGFRPGCRGHRDDARARGGNGC